MKEQLDLAIKLALDSWYAYVQRTDSLLEILSDEQLQNEVSPGKNRGIYLLGHLAAVHDRMIPLLDFGKQLHPEWEEIFIRTPDKSGKEMPSAEELRKYWKAANQALADQFSGMTTDDWFKRHTSVSPEDFMKEPHRNKLGVLISRTTHLSYHFGQLIYLKK